jgi:uncharacterized protein (DUF58 family)
MRRASVAAGLGTALCLTAGAFAAAPLYLPGLALLQISAVAVAWVSLAARQVRLTRRCGMTAVEEQVELPLTVRVLRTRLPLPGAELRASSRGPSLPLPDLHDGTVTTTVRFPRRGRHRLAAASLVLSDPMGLCRRAVFSTEDEILVLPRVEGLNFAPAGGETAILARSAVTAAGAPATEVESLRPHRSETPASRIHWPTVARTTTLMERRLVADADLRPLVVVDPREPSSADALDQAVRAAASLCVHLARHGGCAVLLPGDRRPTALEPELHGWPQLHARIALLEPCGSNPPLAGLARADVVLWVTAATGMSVGLARLRAPVRYLVSPHPDASLPAQFAVAGCSGQRLERARSKVRAA